MPTPQEDRELRALKAVKTSGDVEKTRRLAELIRSRRANTGPGTQATEPLALSESSDPFSNVPTEINGVQLSDEVRQLILIGREAKDPKEKRILAARLAGRFAKEGIIEGDFLDDISNSQFGAALRGFSTGLFGVGDIAAAGGTFLRSQISASGEDKLSFGEALEAQREFRRALEEDFPITSGLAEIGGAFAGGAGVGLVARGVARGGTGIVARTVTRATTLKKGQRVRNVARLAGAGAVAGGVTEGLTEGEAVRGAEFGAVAGPIGVGVLKGGTFIGKAAINRLLKTPAANGLRVLAKKLKEKPEELAARYLEFLEVTGKPPSINDIANPQASAELRTVIAERTGAVTVAREAAQGVTDRRSGEIAEQVTGGRTTAAVETLQNRRISIDEKQFAKADADNIEFSSQEVEDLLLNKQFRQNIGEQRVELDEALSAVDPDSPVILSGLLVNNMRRNLNAASGSVLPGDKGQILDLSRTLVEIAGRKSPNFARAISGSSARAIRTEGVAAGRKVLETTDKNFKATVKAAEDTGDINKLAGLRVGARSALADRARESSARAVALVRSLAEDSGLVERLRTVFPKGIPGVRIDEVDRLQKLARLQRRAAENLNIATPEIRAADAAAVAEAVKDATGAFVAAGGNTGGAFRVSVADRILRRLTPRLSRKAANSLAADLFDPARTKDAIKALRNAGVSEIELLGHFIAALISGQQAATAINE